MERRTTHAPRRRQAHTRTRTKYALLMLLAAGSLGLAGCQGGGGNLLRGAARGIGKVGKGALVGAGKLAKGAGRLVTGRQVFNYEVAPEEPTAPASHPEMPVLEIETPEAVVTQEGRGELMDVEFESEWEKETAASASEAPWGGDAEVALEGGFIGQPNYRRSRETPVS